MSSLQSKKIGIIGLGYVGLPLAVEFGKKFDTVGFDINPHRIKELEAGRDSTLEVSSQELKEASHLRYESSMNGLFDCNVFIVTVPTPITSNNQPDLTPLEKASVAISGVLSAGDIVIYESTVYPGVTEEVCVPLLEANSGLKFNVDFFVGYSPERINPGDKTKRLPDIKKVTSGSTPETLDVVDALYNSIIRAGTHRAPTIRVAEASKVIENVQRDVNIALINELFHIFEKLNIDTKAVIDAAATKWNFMKLYPGLVGGHCISVDPYYLLHKAESVGYIPDLIRSAREINDTMPVFIAQQFVSELITRKINPCTTKVVILGVTFKENCPDLRNTKVIDVYNQIVDLGISCDIYDPLAPQEVVEEELGISLVDDVGSHYDVALLAVGHETIVNKLKNNEFTFSTGFIYDFKQILDS
ncbi:nucleotide sugar dehydrogenase [Glaciecola sp. XM2]|uniref:nucleotide sugar dehydrogenase n=1 Tax=Glaciecola sp. XM2 TaxID=1914931 RepID=UPI001BDF29E0|nr:nucleotide sugar dehydrogenase [Glaciecola sp. XM2]MBT1450665.1 nucleotide sugar dehydrogenase [Glaciecola sp. XM2]